MVDASGNVEAKNPLRYAQSLSDQNYSWVIVRPKDMTLAIVSDWKAEMASHEVGDPAIENSGNNLKIVEVGYSKNSGDDNTYVYFYRTKEDAQAAAQASKQAAADAMASKAKWSQKLMSLPYMIASHDAGFKLVYAVCNSRMRGPNTFVTTRVRRTGPTVAPHRIAGSAIKRGARTP